MKITQCDFCKKIGNEATINDFAELRFSVDRGVLAKFQEKPNRKIELCEKCYVEMVEHIREKANLQ